MVNNIVPIPGYVHLYRSMLRFYDMPSAELKEMLYLLNTANLDSYGFHHPEAHVVESGPVAFCGWLDHRYARPYRTEVQLYKSLLALKRSIDRDESFNAFTVWERMASEGTSHTTAFVLVKGRAIPVL